jgi:putative MATE family efflux protein
MRPMRPMGPMVRPGRHEHDREIGRLAVPALGGLAVEPLYVLTDTAVVGHLGTAQLAGLAVAGTVLTTGFWVFNFLAYGTTAVVARAHGALDHRGAADRAVEALWLAVALGLVLTAVGLAVAGPAVNVFGASDSASPHALQYLKISALGAPAVLVALTGTGYLRGLQNTTTSLAVGLGSNLLNLVIELIAIYGFGLGIAASAWSTVVAQWCAAVVYLAIILTRVRATGASLRPRADGIRIFATFGATLAVRTGALLGAFAVATGVASRISDAALAAHQIAFQLWTFLAFSLDAVAIAGQAMIGRFLGAGDGVEARRAGRRMIEWGVVTGSAAALVVIALRPVLVRLFTSDDLVIAEAETILWVVAAVQLPGSIVFVLDGILVGAGDVRFLAGAMVAASTAFVPLAVIVAWTDRGLVALWLALGVFIAARMAGNLWRFHGHGWIRQATATRARPGEPGRGQPGDGSANR